MPLITANCRPFTAKEIANIKDATITVEATADGIIVGGMSYQLDPALKPRKA